MTPTTTSSSNTEPKSARPPSVAYAERRAWIRYPSHLKMFWQVLGVRSMDVWTARIEDISIKGMGVIADRTFTPGTVLSIRVMGKGSKSRSYLIRVARVQPRDNGEYHLGCTFAKPLSLDDLQALINGLEG